MCGTRNLGIKWKYWHTLVCSSEITIDMRFVCPRDGRKMLVKRARSVYWKKWAAKHEYEELKEGTWLAKESEGGLDWKASKRGQKMASGSRLGAKRDSSILAERVQESVKPATWRMAQSLPLPRVVRSQTGDSRGFQKVGAKKQEPQRRSGSGKEVLLCILSVKANGTGATLV